MSVVDNSPLTTHTHILREDFFVIHVQLYRHLFCAEEHQQLLRNYCITVVYTIRGSSAVPVLFTLLLRERMREKIKTSLNFYLYLCVTVLSDVEFILADIAKVDQQFTIS